MWISPLLTCTNCSNQETWYRRFQMLTLFLEYKFFYLSLPATSAACERSFSVLKRIKNYNRSKMGQERLCSLAVMAIESDLLNSVDFDGLIHDFAESHSRKKALL
jgi:hypothetical protein